MMSMGSSFEGGSGPGGDAIEVRRYQPPWFLQKDEAPFIYLRWPIRASPIRASADSGAGAGGR
jgi:hypothetical protein